MDLISKEHRSWNMSQIHGKDTKPEVLVRSFLHRHGFRFLLHDKRLPGKPDIVFPRYKTVIEVRGCFWHRHPGCPYAYTPKSRLDFWLKKFDENVLRDKRNDALLRERGWTVIIIWECEVTNLENLEHLVQLIRF